MVLLGELPADFRSFEVPLGGDGLVNSVIGRPAQSGDHAKISVSLEVAFCEERFSRRVIGNIAEEGGIRTEFLNGPNHAGRGQVLQRCGLPGQDKNGIVQNLGATFIWCISCDAHQTIRLASSFLPSRQILLRHRTGTGTMQKKWRFGPGVSQSAFGIFSGLHYTLDDLQAGKMFAEHTERPGMTGPKNRPRFWKKSLQGSQHARGVRDIPDVDGLPGGTKENGRHGKKKAKEQASTKDSIYFNHKVMTTMSDVARAAGCSTMAVSLALRGSHEVSKATRERIGRLARELGYRPNPLVSALVAQRRRRPPSGEGTIGLLTKFDQPISRWPAKKPFYSELMEGVVQQANALGFAVEEFTVASENPSEGARLTNILRTRGIRGLLLFPGGPLRRNFPPLGYEHFAVASVAFHALNITIHRVAADYAASMEQALFMAESRGCKRIGLAMTRHLDPTTRYAFSGRFLAWQASLPAARGVPLLRTEEASQEAIRAWLRRHRPDCILTLNPLVKKWLQELKIAVPRDISLISLSLRDQDATTGIDQRPAAIGRAAVKVLVRELLLNHYGIPEVAELTLVQGKWVEGATLRSARDAQGFAANTSPRRQARSESLVRK